MIFFYGEPKPMTNRRWNDVKTQMRLKNEPENRSTMLRMFEKLEKDIVSEIRADRTYKLPKNYISWETISQIAGLSLITGNDRKNVSEHSGFVHSHKFALWFIKDTPIYLMSPDLFEAFDRTKALEKPGIMSGWQPSLPSFLLAIPKGYLHTPAGAEVDYLLVSFSDIAHKEWAGGRWKKYRIDINEPYASPTHRFFQIVTIDHKEIIWTSGTGVSMSGSAELLYSDVDWGNLRLTPDDRQFISRLRNLAINSILTIQFASNLITEVADGEVCQPTTKGFAKQTAQNIRYGRWLGKNYKRRVGGASLSGGGTHSSPYPHWREGHWRVLEVNEGKPWRQNQRLWIEPVYIAGD